MEDFTKTILILLIAAARVAAALAVAPFFGSGSPAGLPRRAFIVSSVLILVPMLLPTIPNQSFSPLFMGVLILKEVFIGLLFGFASGVGFWAMQAAGEYIDLQRGATAGAYFNPLLGGMNSPMGDLMLRFAVMLFLSTGGLLIFFSALLTSFEVYSPWQLLPELKVAKIDIILLLAGRLFELSLLYGAPLLVLFLLIDLGLGFMSRFVPSLNVFFFSLPVKSVVGILLLIVYLPFVAWVFSRDLFSSNSLLAWIRSVLS